MNPSASASRGPPIRQFYVAYALSPMRLLSPLPL
jgi:hypothetical protein